MPRSRNLKPGFFTNDDLAECGPLGHLLFAGLWVLADREGRLLDRPKKIKAETLPYYDADAEHLLTQLAERGFIVRYTTDGCRYIQLMNWGKHQTPHFKEPASTIPAPDEYRASLGPDLVKPQSNHGQDQGKSESRLVLAPPDTGYLIPDTGYRIPDTRAPTELERAREKTDPPSPNLSVHRDKHDEEIPPSSAAPPKPPKPVPKPQAARVPDDFLVTEPLRQLAIKTGLPPESIEEETAKFLDHFRSNGKTMVDWTAAWRNWMRRAVEFKPQVWGSPVTKFPTVAEQNAAAFATVRKAMGLDPEPAMNMIDVEVKPR